MENISIPLKIPELIVSPVIDKVGLDMLETQSYPSSHSPVSFVYTTIVPGGCFTATAAIISTIEHTNTEDYLLVH
jgi:hypothetical protein